MNSKAYFYIASYIHEPPNQVIGVGVIFFRGELRGVEFGGSQDLQHALQSLGYRYWTALLGCVDDIYYLEKKAKKVPILLQNRHHTETLAQRALCKTHRNRVPLSLCMCHGAVHVMLKKSFLWQNS